MALAVEEICAVILIALHLFVIVPLLVTSSIILYQNQKCLHFKKRGIAFLVAHLIFSFLIHGILSPIGLTMKLLDHHVETVDEKLLEILTRIDPARSFLQNCFIMAIFLNIIFRLFYQFVQIQRSKHTLILIKLPKIQPLAIENNGDDTNCEYSPSDIDMIGGESNGDSDDFGKLNFIFDNYHIFGNPTRICAIELSIWLFLSIGFLFSSFNFIVKNETFRFISGMSVYFIAFSFTLGSAIYLTKKQRVLTFDDHWGIRKEFSYYALVFSCIGTVYIMFAIDLICFSLILGSWHCVCVVVLCLHSTFCNKRHFCSNWCWTWSNCSPTLIYDIINGCNIWIIYISEFCLGSTIEQKTTATTTTARAANNRENKEHICHQYLLFCLQPKTINIGCFK